MRKPLTLSTACAAIALTTLLAATAAKAEFRYRYPVVGPSVVETGPAQCALPWGGSLAHGASVTAYQSATSFSACTAESRSCANGTLSGAFLHQACTITAAASCKAAQGGGATSNGAYAIQPAGSGAPLTAECLQTLAGGGWTRLTASVANTTLNTGGHARRYLYYRPATGGWVLSPPVTRAWSWSSKASIGGDGQAWVNSLGQSMTCGTSEMEYSNVGLSCGNGGGPSGKILANLGDPASGTIEAWADGPVTGPALTNGSSWASGIAVYIREGN